MRIRSLNLQALQALKLLATSDFEVTIYNEVGRLPLFNPDLESKPAPALTRLKQQLLSADVLVLASPEYAHGISGVMKNLLDHLVSGEEFVDKPVVLINTSPRANHAQLALRERGFDDYGCSHH